MKKIVYLMPLIFACKSNADDAKNIADSKIKGTYELGLSFSPSYITPTDPDISVILSTPKLMLEEIGLKFALVEAYGHQQITGGIKYAAPLTDAIRSNYDVSLGINRFVKNDFKNLYFLSVKSNAMIEMRLGKSWFGIGTFMETNLNKDHELKDRNVSSMVNMGASIQIMSSIPYN